MPATTEDFRQRMKTLAMSYVIAGYKHSSRLWLRTATMPVFAAYVEHILSDQVAAYHLDSENVSVRASWPTVLSYELNMRKLVVRMVLYESMDFGTALARAMVDLQCRERHFITPTALITAAKGHHPAAAWQGPPPDAFNTGGKGKGKSANAKKRARSSDGKDGGGKGKPAKGGVKGKGKGKQLLKTPDGRLICGFVNLPQGCVKPRCNFLHCCNLCFATDHVAANCPV